MVRGPARRLNRQQMAGALRSRPSALVVDLGGGDVAVAEEVLDLDDVHVGVEQERGCRRAEGVRSVDAALHGPSISELLLFRSCSR